MNEPDDSPDTPLSRNRDFVLIWTSQTLSETGTGATQLALPLLVLALTGSPATAGLVATIAAVIEGVLRLPGGVVADRYGRRRVMLLSDTCRFVAMLVLVASLLFGFVSLPLVLIVIGIVAASSVVFSPAETASLSRIVPAHQLPLAFAQNEARTYAAGLVGPPLGGLLYGLNRVVPFVFDLITYVVSFGAIAAIKSPLDSTDRGEPAGMLEQLREGLQFVWRSPFLRAVIGVASLLNFAAIVALFGTTITLREAGYSAATVGVAQGVAALGGLVGALLAGRMMAGRSVRTLVLRTTAAITICLVAATVLAGSIWMVLPIAAGLAFAPTANAALMGRLAATTPNDVQGRVISVVILFATAAAGVAPVLVGVLAEYTNAHLALSIGIVAATGSAIVAISSRGLRTEST